MLQNETAVQLKSVEVDGFKVELLAENKGMTFRVNVRHTEGYPRTRVFVDFAEASALFDSYLQGN